MKPRAITATPVPPPVPQPTLKFKSVTAAIDAGFTRTPLQSCLNGNQKAHAGYVWTYS